MWTVDKVFYDLVNTAGLGERQRLQEFVDRSKDMYNKQDLTGFPFAPKMQPDFSFEQISREYGINAMATWVDIDSDGTPITVDGKTLQTGKIPRNKKYAAFDENEYRQMMISRVMGISDDELAMSELLRINRKLIDSHNNALTYMRHQMVSKGQFELSANNNAGGITGHIYSANIPAGNKVTTSWFNADGSAIADSDPVKDLREMKNKVNGVAYHWEVDVLTLNKTLNHPAVLLAIGYSKNAAVAADAALNVGNYTSDAERKSILESLIGFPIVTIDSISRVDKFEKGKGVVGTEVRSFEPNKWALIPNGKLGETLAVAPIAIGDSSSFATYHGGRLLITYDYDVRKKTQYIQSEMTALVVPDKPKYMYILTVE